MHSPLAFRVSRWFGLGACAAARRRRHGLAAGVCAIAAALLPNTAPRALAQTCTTTITGTVYSPNGQDPLPNILVYVPTTAVQPFPAGVSSCAAESQLVSGNPLVSTTTAFDGTFSLTSTSPAMAGNQTLVIQAGKWRRVYSNVNVTGCQTNAVPAMAMPQNQSQGDIPAIAISTGSVDALECVFRKMGISDSEFTNMGGGGRINLFAGSESSGATIGGTSPSETTLVSNPAVLNSYDLALFACQGTPTNPAATPVANQQNLVNFANVGGRIFATHYSYVWLNNSTVFKGTANWIGDESIASSTTVPINATIDQSYAEGAILAQWLYKIGASPTLGQLPLYETRKDQTGVNPPTQSWATLNDPTYNNPVMQFTFDTPINVATTPTVVLGFTNNPANFMLGDTADTVTVNVTDSAAAAADTTLNLTLTLPPGLTPVSLAGANANTGWVCPFAIPLTCNRTKPLAAGANDPVALVVSVPATAPVGNATISAALAGGGLSGTNQCGRVLFNEYHVENTSDHGLSFPNECDNSAMTPQEKFLEFSLYNLSNFVAPVSSDTVLIQGLSSVTWTTPAPVTYGTALSGTQLDATANVPGTFAYTPAAGTVPGVGNDTLSVVFTPTNPGYLSSTGSVVLSVLPAASTTTITDMVTPIYYGQIIGDVAKVIVSAPNTGGDIDVFIDNQNVCVLPVIAGTTETCPPTTGVGYNAGTHSIYATFTGNPEYTPSTSPVYQVVVLPDPTTAQLVSSANPAIVGQAVQLTATIGDQYATAAGVVNFYDGTALIGSGTLNAQGVATLMTTALVTGAHNITACLVASLNFKASCSSVLQQQVTLVPSAPLATVTLLGSSVNPSVVGQSVTFSASVATTGAFASIPTGSVAFRDGTTTLGTVTLDGKGDASFSTSALTAGLHTITAAYSGVSVTNVASPMSLAASVSAPVMQQVNTSLASAGVGFVMTVTPTTFSAGIGVSTPVSVTITDLNGFDQPVQLACAGLPHETTCTFAQSTIAAGGGATTLMVSPAPPRPCSAGTTASGPRSAVPWAMAFALGAFFVRRRRRLLQGLALTAVLCLLPLLNGCGNCTDLGTEPGSYTFTVAGTATGATPVVTSATGSAALSQTQTMQMVLRP